MLSKKMKKMGLTRKDLIGKVAVITGGGRGIGKELSRALSWLGAKVAIAEITNDGANVESLIRAEGGTALYVKTDVSDEISVKNLAEKVFREFGKVDILINNATIVEVGSISEMSLDKWEKSWNVNVLSAVRLIKTFLPGMLKRRCGVITTITSDEGMPYVAPYSASKAALCSIGLSLAAELKEKSWVHVFVFAPGMVDTPGIRKTVRALAPFYNMTYEDFINQNVNPGYKGLMPAEDCAAGFAYCIVHSGNYHGQIADPFQPLIKTGLLNFSLFKGGSKKCEFEKKPIEKKPILEVAKEVKGILEGVEKETNELDLFKKMWVNRTFRKRCGMSITDWLDTITKFIAELEEHEEDRMILNNDKSLWIKSNLNKLKHYFKENKKDARGYFNDQKELSKALEILNYREKTVNLLINLIEKGDN